MGNTDGDEKSTKMAQAMENHSRITEDEEGKLGSDLEVLCTLAASSSSAHKAMEEEEEEEETETSFPHEVLEHVLEFLTSRKDRNSVSLVCKSWYKVEAWTRYHVFIGNCYSASPSTMINRFPKVKSLTLKGKPRFADFNLVPKNWGAYLHSWVLAMGPAYPWLETLSLKRMTVTDDDLLILANSFPNFKELILFYCDGFSTEGLAIIASKCRQLQRFDLNEDDIVDSGNDWLSCFPQTTTTLVCLAFDCLVAPINYDALERLVARSPSLKELKLNASVSIVQLYRLMLRAPQLTHLGTGCFSYDFIPEQATILQVAFHNCKSLQSLSGFHEVVLEYLPTIYSVCNNLTDLNFSYAVIGSRELEQIVCKCPKLQRLWVLDSVEDAGLWAAAATCKDLRDLRVFPVDPREDGQGSVSNEGLVAISEGCPNLQSILYFCQRMTNAAVVTMSKNCPKLASFRLCIMGRHKPDHITGEPMDEGFGAIVMNCKNLTRLAVSGLLTNKTFEYIGTYGKSLETLSVAFAGENDLSMKYVLDGCRHLRKLEIRDSPFGDVALLSGLHHYENMRFLWMSSCKVSMQGCMELAKRMPLLNVEIIKENENDDPSVEKLYVYRSVAGHRKDSPSFVITL
ncbi:hypothetical protein SUGI_0404760 [Cryptomeria japonica]|uniref:transport inhibitor response 1-like protein n=1 Tax=Cryptomeria japonica TaxID=3369 RepID=UPI002408EF5D|nr:transport inhibitor response 1-like protein [Cryptomeria japonica]GLJ21719.1 hypothetical protein SUGI_0404760 [Cryptomeria japonica]